ncbi:MAG: formylglycine-generating enzyme family protein [Bauldia sp.]|uniref:formylglycine-generating enzyme family protein n=1 Tax=Bauldia sp. TaxID=2575872 RepID=UPI001DC25180|nr:formylglycine-generating enzyme family protein [Bauldia sp.]MCB1496293.1 formylglycine-generating enzyme family protein [Bauldia sp.]
MLKTISDFRVGLPANALVPPVSLAAALLCLAANGHAQDGAPAPGSTFRDCDNCPEMVVVPAGRFVMGAGDNDPAGRDDEAPAHEVAIPSFAVGRFEVTRGAFAAFVDATDWKTDDACVTYEDESWQAREGRTWRDPGFPVDDTHPVNCVTTDDVGGYLAWLSEMTGEDYRLPSEAEWEYAARAGSVTPFYFGEDKAAICDYANAADRSAKAQFPDWTWTSDCDDGHPFTAPVGSFKPNAFGLYDMTGNVWEWVADCYHDTYTGAPADGSAWTASPCERRMSRGGGLFDSPDVLRVAFRGGGKPASLDFESGFRIARSIRQDQ